MVIEVRLFAGLREQLGSSIQIEVDGNEQRIPLTKIKDELCRQFPQAVESIRSAMVAVNQEYANWEKVVQLTDEVALIPPVSGG